MSPETRNGDSCVLNPVIIPALMGIAIKQQKYRNEIRPIRMVEWSFWGFGISGFALGFLLVSLRIPNHPNHQLRFVAVVVLRVSSFPVGNQYCAYICIRVYTSI